MFTNSFISMYHTHLDSDSPQDCLPSSSPIERRQISSDNLAREAAFFISLIVSLLFFRWFSSTTSQGTKFHCLKVSLSLGQVLSPNWPTSSIFPIGTGRKKELPVYRECHLNKNIKVFELSQAKAPIFTFLFLRKQQF